MKTSVSVSRKPKSKCPARAIRKANRRRKASSLEKDVYKILREEGIPFQREKLIGRCHADIFIGPRTVIELNGCYWHGCPVCTKKLNQMQEESRAKDARRYYFFKKLGFDVRVIWECEVHKDPESVRDLLVSLGKKETV
jgi:G:T-mismatch repair DNA endonuclease (very short patch repair protein)